METNQKQKALDSVILKKRKTVCYDLPLTDFVNKHKNSSTLFSRYGKTKNFSTDNLYLHLIKNDHVPDFSSLDGFLTYKKPISLRYAIRNRLRLYGAVLEQYGDLQTYFKENVLRSFQNMSTVKLWNVSIVGSLVVGMFLMTFIYRYLGQGAAAVSIRSNEAVSAQEVLGGQRGQVLGADAENDSFGKQDSSQVENYVSQIMQDYQDKSNNNKQLESEMAAMVKGYPIEKMVPYIAQQDRMVAAFMIGIAKQESDWGVHVPVGPNGEECYNDWGYRGKNAVGTGGHSCFSSPKDAVDTVAKRLQFLVSNEKMTTPDKMVVVWKCGYDCSWDKPAAVNRWVEAVNYYFKQFNEKGERK